ncbi:MAG TPA: sensor histidine kinase [Candidatus Dormibacteraeota bacterium]|nr:sensor histidine kinase [Candidatus Dormibacteraeota bacterium]
MTAAIERFRHEALLYSGNQSFVAGCVPFIRDGLDAGEPVLVVESAGHIELLRAALGADAEQVRWADMNAVGANPARIIPAWQDFVAEHGGDGKRLRGIGEPISNERSADELIECQRHESLLNVAFGKGPAWWLLCPYDSKSLPASVIDEARRSHEYVTELSGSTGVSDSFRGHDACGATFDTALPEPNALRAVLQFDRDNLLSVRRLVTRQALAIGLAAKRATDLATAVNEVATNSIVHGGGNGTLRVWREPGALICDVRDGGVYRSPLGDRTKPGPGLRESRGLWLANQLCDLVQIRDVGEGTVVRLHMRLAGQPT